MLSVIECRCCGDELRAEIPIHELWEDARNLGWQGLKCPACIDEEANL